MTRIAPWLVAALLAVLYVADYCGDSGREDALAEAARERIDSLTAVLADETARADGATARADSAEARAVEADTVLVRIVDSIAVVVSVAEHETEASDSTFLAVMDSLRARVQSDPVAVGYVARATEAHAETLEAAHSVAAALRVQLGATDRALALSRAARREMDADRDALRAVIETQGAIIAEHEERDELQAAQLRKAGRENRLLKLAVAAGGVLAGVQALTGG